MPSVCLQTNMTNDLFPAPGYHGLLSTLLAWHYSQEMMPQVKYCTQLRLVLIKSFIPRLLLILSVMEKGSATAY